MWHAPVDGGRGREVGSRTAVVLGAKDRERPGRLARMRTAQVQAAARAQIPLPCDSGETPTLAAEKVGRAVNGVRPCVARHPEGGVEHPLSDGARSDRPRSSTSSDYGPFAFSRVLTLTPSSAKRSEPMGLPVLRLARTNGEPLGCSSQYPNRIHTCHRAVAEPPPRPDQPRAGTSGRPRHCSV